MLTLRQGLRYDVTPNRGPAGLQRPLCDQGQHVTVSDGAHITQRARTHTHTHTHRGTKKSCETKSGIIFSFVTTVRDCIILPVCFNSRDVRRWPQKLLTREPPRKIWVFCEYVVTSFTFRLSSVCRARRKMGL